MPAANADYVRDAVADANPDLTRKRQRLSEEADETSPLSTKDDILIEEVPMEEDGSSLANAIELHDDLDGGPLAPFSDIFLLSPANDMTAPQQIEWLRGHLATPNTHMDPAFFAVLATALGNHVTQAQALPDLGRTKYIDEQDFFDKLGEVCFRILARHTLFEKHILEDKRCKAEMLQHINDFMQNINDMCLNVLEILPSLMESISTRRDSGSIREGPQRNSLLWFIRILGQSLAGYNAGVFSHFKDFDFRPVASRKIREQQFLGFQGATDRLVTLLRKLTKYNKQLIDSAWDEQAWEAVSAILHVQDKLQVDKPDHIRAVLKTLHEDVLPVTCNRKKQALPVRLHELSISLSEKLLSQLLASADTEATIDIYTTYTRSDDDALFPQRTDGGALVQQLVDLSDSDVEVQRSLMSTASWLQQMNRLLHSDIMDFCNYGISELNTRLPKIYTQYRDSPQGLEHPVLVYIARFLRCHEVIRFIFGPNSHSSLINYSRDIVGFLAAINNYTNQETDVIWQACTESVEVEKVKASWSVLHGISGLLDIDHLLYLVEQFSLTARSKLSNDMIAALSDLFSTVSKTANGPLEGENRLKTAFVSIDLMMGLDATSEDPVSKQLRRVATHELLRFMGPDYTTGDRHQIFARCIQRYGASGGDATAAVTILNSMLSKITLSPDDTQDLLGMLSVPTAIKELGHFVEDRRALEDRNSTRLSIIARLIMILHLMTLAHETWAVEIAQLLFDIVVGDLALDNTARDLAWTYLSNVVKGTPQPSRVVRLLFKHFISNLASEVSLTHTTPRLVALLGASLGSPKDEYEMLGSPVWAKLVHCAESSGDDRVRQAATDTIRGILCNPDVPLPKGIRPVELQSKFTERQIERVLATSGKPGAASQQLACRQLDLLDAVLQASAKYPARVKTNKNSKLDLDPNSAENKVHFLIEVYWGGKNEPEQYHSSRSKTTKLRALADRLPALTGAYEHRLILGGKLVDLTKQADETLSSIGLQSSGVLQICPKYTIQSDINRLMKPVGTVEQTIMSHYKRIEALLVGTSEIARRTYDLLKQIRPPDETRDRVTSPQTELNEICPISSKWRIMMTAHVLKTHLLDFANIGVVDQTFFMRGTRILIAVVMAWNQMLDPQITTTVLDCLVCFLQERAETTVDVKITQEPDRLVTRMLDMCFRAVELHTKQSDLAEQVYKALLHAFQQQPEIWDSFVADSRTVDLHRQLLLSTNAELLGKVSTMIETFCKESFATSEGGASFYLKVLLGLVPDALSPQGRNAAFFQLATNILHADTTLPADEEGARDTMQELVTALWQYRHTETPNFPQKDAAMAGLLQLLLESIQVVRSAKKPLALEGFALQVFTQLLFPNKDGSCWQALLDEQSRSVAFRLVKATCESEEDIYGIIDRAFSALQETGNDPAATYPGRDKFLRAATEPSGLPNLRNTCYMNSLLQQLFANTKFRKFIFSIPLPGGSQETVLAAVSRLFANMQDGYFTSIDVAHLAKLLDIDVWIQEDVHTFYENFLSRLEADMPSADYKAQLARFYTGNLVSQVKGACGHVSSRLEEFVDIPIVVTNQKDLASSLEAYIQGEQMEGQNRYRCSACDPSTDGRLVDAMKRSCIEDLPDNVTFCLKRFSFEAMFGGDASKENGRFEFPQSIDLGKYTRAQLEDPEAKKDEDIFELVGVIVHWGTLTSGHYWSYTLVRNTASPDSRKWLRLNDSTADTVKNGLSEVQEECFGGGLGFDGKPRQDSAYVLFYQRKTSLEEQVAIATPVSDYSCMDPMPARVSLPPALEEELCKNNTWHQRIAQLFDDDFASFLAWAMENFGQYTTWGSSPSDTSISSREGPTGATANDLVNSSPDFRVIQAMNLLVATYYKRVVVCQPVSWKKLNTLVPSLKKLVSEQAIFAGYFLNQIIDDTPWFSKMILHEKRIVRTTTYELVVACLTALKQCDTTAYQSGLRQAVNIHSNMIHSNLSLGVEADYINFAIDLANLGAEEMAFILGEGYYTWAVHLLMLPANIRRQKHNPGLWHHFTTHPNMVSALYDFVHIVISAQLELEKARKRAIGSSDSGVSLYTDELDMLVKHGNPEVFYWMYAARHANKPNDWTTSSPGRLLSLLCEALPPQTMDMVESSLLGFIAQEEESFPAVMSMVLHYLSCDLPLERALPACNALGTTLIEWAESEEEFLNRIKDAYSLASVAILQSTKIWLRNMLTMHSKGTVRRGTRDFLMQEIFTGPAISDDEDCDAARAQFAMNMVTENCGVLKQAYSKEYARARYEPTIAIGRTAVQHLHDLCDEATKLRADAEEEEEDADDPVSMKLQIWIDEAQRAWTAWAQLEEDVLGDWSLEDEIVLRGNTRAESVEVSDGYYTSDYDEDMEDGSPMA
ncbi:Ubiquitin carboxyl-terminal hydrolase puf [Fulvia fulva]|uniref:Ubiquitin carboxyl-terminal hydrolase puf n=1 Tax=Passalora fulva TaxID=5499 RepID=A0A9Q8LHR8_PASFU|nr:Ubiquitin carboxyl-terminal hydrolase puf [Fulvia fulva]KAK4625638.1 Ubiquitin carboxyl-terminal hydrolase puf [Fulvia fulva]UJO17720.1 Ubiquitin carboxyl-terminal hydrolase puf [Fulvia fulva]